MVAFDIACEKAANFLKETGHLKGFRCVRENEKSWFFCGRFEANSNTEYGNLPVRVSKETGKCEYFQLFLSQNLKEYNSSLKVEVPKKYLL